MLNNFSKSINLSATSDIESEGKNNVYECNCQF